MPDPRQTSEFSQGDIFALRRLPVVGQVNDGMPEVEYVDCPNGVMLVNQTCDALRADYLQVAPAPKAKRSGFQGALLREVTCIRVEDEHNWENGLVYTLSLSFLVSPGTLPLVDDDEEFGCVPAEVTDRIERSKVAERPERIAEFIVRAADYGLSAASVCELWQWLVDSWLGQCDVAYGNLGRPSRVSGKGEVIPEDEYTFDRYRRSEQLDLDYLSRDSGGEG